MFRSASMIAVLAGLATGVNGQADLFWNAGSGVWSDPLNWNPQNVPDNTGENALLLSPSGAVVTLDISPGILGLTVGAGITLDIPQGRAFFIHADSVNNGLINLNPTTSTLDSYIQFNANLTLSGTGTLRLAGGLGNDAFLNSAGGVAVTNGPDHIIDGTGVIYAEVINEGVIESRDTGFGTELALAGSPKTNNGTIRPPAGTTLSIGSISISQGPSGVLHADAGGEIRLDGSQTLAGGRLTVAPGGVVRRTANGVLTLQGIVIEDTLTTEAGGVVYCNGAVLDCPGTILINDSTSTLDAYMQFLNDCTATGGGEIVLAGSGNDSYLNTSGGVTLTIDPTFAIGGSGQVPAAIINNGVVHAYPLTHGDGRLLLHANAKTNNALMVADDGGVLEIYSMTLSQGLDGVIRADPGGVVQFTGNPTVIGGTIDRAGDGLVERTPNGALHLEDVTLDGDMHLREGGVIYFTGSTIVNNAELVVNNTNSTLDAYVQATTNCTLSGTGALFLAGSYNDSMVLTSGGVSLTLAPGATIEGAGQIHASLINRGLVRTRTGPNADGRLTLLGNPKINEADMIAETDGVLEFSSVGITQTGPGRILADGGVVSFIGNPTIDGGVLDSTNGGVLSRESNGTLYLAHSTLESELYLQPGSVVLYTSDEFVNNGTVVVNDSNSTLDSYFQFHIDGTVMTGTGSIHLAGGSNDSMILTSGGVTSTIGAEASVTGSGQVHAALINNGTFRAFPTDHGDGRLTLRSDPKTNNALMRAEAGGVLELYSSTLTQGPGGRLLADAGTIEFTGNPTLVGGTLATDNGGRIVRTGNGTLYLADATLDGDLELLAGSVVLLTGTSITNNASIIVNDSNSTLDSSLQFHTQGLIDGTGRVLLGGGGNDSMILCSGGATGTFGPNQTIEGEGEMHGTFFVNGTLAPGLPIGTIGGNGVLDLGPTATLDLEAEGDPGTHDRVARAGDVDLGGTLRFRFRNGMTPAAFPAVYPVLSGHRLTGDFDALDLPQPVVPGSAVYVGHDGTTVSVAFTCPADNAVPFGVLDLADITGFVSAFLAHEPPADLAEPLGVFDLGDITAFISGFTGGCP